jgi:hypothetical protein
MKALIVLCVLNVECCICTTDAACCSAALQEEVDCVLGSSSMPSMQQYAELKYILRCVNESMRLYPHPPVLLFMLLLEPSQKRPSLCLWPQPQYRSGKRSNERMHSMCSVD